MLCSTHFHAASIAAGQAAGIRGASIDVLHPQLHLFARQLCKSTPAHERVLSVPRLRQRAAAVGSDLHTLPVLLGQPEDQVYLILLWRDHQAALRAAVAAWVLVAPHAAPAARLL